MSDLRVLTDAELDMVSGGALSIVARPAPSEAPIVKLVEELIVDILRILKPKQPGRPMQAQKA